MIDRTARQNVCLAVSYPLVYFSLCYSEYFRSFRSAEGCYHVSKRQYSEPVQQTAL